jgi:hypothetical protein
VIAVIHYIHRTHEARELARERRLLEGEHGQVWDTQELCRDFEVRSFLAPYVSVVRRSDGVRGLLRFQHLPRFYWGFVQ